MRTTLLLAAASLVVTPAFAGPGLSIEGRFAHPPVRASALQTLYDQTGGNSGMGVVSQNFEPEFDIYDVQAADDFIVPDGTRWTVKEVDVLGTYFAGIGPSRSQNVVFYRNKHGLPGKIVAEFDAVVGLDDGQGPFVIDLGRGLKLKPGHYWMSIQSNQDFEDAGEWGWVTSTSIVASPSAFRNPREGFMIGCADWTVESECVGGVEGDHLFALKGKARTG